jgi:hypothetical protein
MHVLSVSVQILDSRGVHWSRKQRSGDNGLRGGRSKADGAKCLQTIVTALLAEGHPATMSVASGFALESLSLSSWQPSRKRVGDRFGLEDASSTGPTSSQVMKGEQRPRDLDRFVMLSRDKCR